MSKTSKRIAAFALAATGLTFAAFFIGEEIERGRLNNEYQDLHDNFFAQSTPLFSSMDWDNDLASRCLSAIEEARTQFIITSLQRISHLTRTETHVPKEMVRTHIDQTKPYIEKYEKDCKPFL